MSDGDEMASVLKCLLPDAHGLLCLRLVVPDIKCNHFSRTRLQWCLLKNPQVRLPGTQVCAKPGLQDKTGWADK
jgi:hypothetical protein